MSSLRVAVQQHHENHYYAKLKLQKEEKLLRANEAKIASYEADLLGLNAQLVAEADDYAPLPLMDGGSMSA